MEQRESLAKRENETRPRARRKEPSAGTLALGVLGGLALLGIAALVVVALPDIKRYIRISTM
ncbi:MAG: hypothetical protein JSS81_16965 [Acidobacteria bacterium]|nr:hypothetical protein [Acidobacteriota bacterium]